MAKPSAAKSKPHRAAATAKKAAKPAPAASKPHPKPTPKAGSRRGAAAPPKVVEAAKPAAKARPELTTKITHLIAEEMAIEEAELTPAASFKEDLGLDDIDIAELLMQCETAFGVHPFGEDDWESCETVEDFTKLVEKRVAAKRSKKA